MSFQSFAEVLRECIDSNGISYRNLARNMGISESLLNKYMSTTMYAKRFPTKEIVLKLEKNLTLSPNQKEKIWESYYREFIGNRNYDTFESMKKLLEGLLDFQVKYNLSVKRGNKTEEGFLNTVFVGKIGIQNMLVDLIEQVSERDLKKIDIKLLIQSTENQVLDALMAVCYQKEVEVEFIVCLDRNRENNENFKVLETVMKLICNQISCVTRYYYGNPDIQFGITNLVPNLILIEDYVILLNADMNEGIVLNNIEGVQYFRRQYENIRKITEPFVEIERNLEDLMKNSFIMTNAVKTFEINRMPCLTLGFNQGMLRKHLKMEGEQKEIISIQTCNMRDIIINKAVFWNYFSEEGVREFFETGKIPLYSDEFYERPDKQTRLTIIKKLAELSEKGQYHFCIVKKEFIELSYKCTFEFNTNGKTLLRWTENGMNKSILIQEKSICEQMQKFVDYIQEREWVYSEKESQQRLEKIIKEYDVCKK